jgi:hypothetical protein
MEERTILYIKKNYGRNNMTSYEKNYLTNQIIKYMNTHNKYTTNIRTSAEIVHEKIPDIRSLLTTLSIMKKIYVLSNGNFMKFKKLMMDKDITAYMIFRILTESMPLQPIVTYSYFDRLAIHIMINWFKILNKSMPQMRSLLVFVDNL